MARQRTISKIIPFVRDDEGDYEAIHGGVRFSICKAIDHGRIVWGVTAYRASDNQQLHTGISIQWHSAQRRAVAACENILHRELSAATEAA